MKKGVLMKHAYSYLIVCILLCCLSGCTRYACWVQDIFNQGTRVPTYVASGKKYVRSLHVYDYLTTLGLFEALWLSDEVRTIYARLCAQKRCLSDCQKEAYCDAECTKNDATTTFIVLAWVKGYTNTDLTDECPLWSLCLDVNCKRYPVCSIKIIDVCPEYQAMFGRVFTRFKTAYQVTFAVGQDALEAAGRFALVFKTIGLEDSMVWCLNASGKPYIQDTIDKNILMYDIK